MSKVRTSEQIIRKLQPVYKDRTHRHKIVSSGRAGTKSSAAAIEAVMEVVRKDPGSVVIIRKRQNKLRGTVYNEVKRAIRRLGLKQSKFDMRLSPMKITYKPTGNTIYFFGSDNPDDSKGKIDDDGRPIRKVIIDEVSDFFIAGGQGADEIHNIEATFIRGNHGGFQMLYCYNPPRNPNAEVNVWVREMEQRPDCKHVHVTYLDVPEDWLGEDLIQSAEMMKATDRKQYDWLWLGIPTGIDDLVYYMFRKSSHVRDISNKIYACLHVGVDYGQMNATTYQAFGLDERSHRLDGLAEYYHSGRDGKQRSPSDYGNDFAIFAAALAGKYKCAAIYVHIDPSAKGLAEEIKRATRSMPVQVIIKDAQNDVKLGISRVMKLLTFGRISFSTTQSMAVDEFGLYEYEPKSVERGDERPIKMNDHCMDAIRYAVMGAWSRLKPFLPKTEKEDK